MYQKFKVILSSPWLLRASIGLFVLQAVFLSFAVPYKSPSDEEYHFRLTDIYSQRSVLAGPVITDQTDNFNLGDIQRTPGYLYHYLMSFILRSIKPVFKTVESQVLVLRLVNVALGVWAILLFVHLLKRIRARGMVVNLTVAWLAMTTMFTWVFAALSYDNLAFVLFFGLLHVLLSLYQKTRFLSTLHALALSFALMLTKETFLPVIFLCYVLLAVGLLRRQSLPKLRDTLVRSLTADWQKSAGRKLVVLASLLVLVTGGLFVERYGQNYIRYHKTTPACTAKRNVCVVVFTVGIPGNEKST